MDAMTKLVGLAKLRREAHTAAGRASHVLLWDAPRHGESGSTQIGRCACGLEAHISIRTGKTGGSLAWSGSPAHDAMELAKRCPAEKIRYAGDTKNIGESRADECEAHGFPAAECPWCTPDQHAQADQAAGDTTDMGEDRT